MTEWFSSLSPFAQFVVFFYCILVGLYFLGWTISMFLHEASRRESVSRDDS